MKLTKKEKKEILETFKKMGEDHQIFLIGSKEEESCEDILCLNMVNLDFGSVELRFSIYDCIKLETHLYFTNVQFIRFAEIVGEIGRIKKIQLELGQIQAD